MAIMMEYIICDCEDFKDCDCLSTVDNKNEIFMFHAEAICEKKYSYSVNHDWHADCYFKVQRPVWQQHCYAPFTDRYKTFVNQLWKLFNITCTCETLKLCNPCRWMVGHGNGEFFCPHLYINDWEIWDLHHFEKLIPFLNFETVIQEPLPCHHTYF